MMWITSELTKFYIVFNLVNNMPCEERNIKKKICESRFIWFCCAWLSSDRYCSSDSSGWYIIWVLHLGRGWLGVPSVSDWPGQHGASTQSASEWGGSVKDLRLKETSLHLWMAQVSRQGSGGRTKGTWPCTGFCKQHGCVMPSLRLFDLSDGGFIIFKFGCFRAIFCMSAVSSWLNFWVMFLLC